MAGPTLAPTNIAAVKIAATAAEMLLETFENILISFRLETVFRIVAKMSETLHDLCHFYKYFIFQLVVLISCQMLNYQ